MNTGFPSPKRKRRSAQPPSTPLSVLVDRSLPADLVATACRGFGWTAQTLVDVYGAAVAQETDDETWIDHAGQEDGSWDFLCNTTTDPEYLQTVHAEEMFSRFSNDLAPLRSLAPGHLAERDDPGSQWLVEPYTE